MLSIAQFIVMPNAGIFFFKQRDDGLQRDTLKSRLVIK